MKVCVFGAGAVGGVMGGLLAAAGAEVSLIARGAHLEALRRDGCKVDAGGRRFHTHPVCADDPAGLGPQDYVILSVKAPGLAAAAERIAPLLGPETAVVTAMNGVPWWFFDGFPPAHAPAPAPAPVSLPWLDPGGRIARAIPFRRVVGCVIHLGAVVPEPGVVRLVSGDRVILGEPGGEPSARVRALADALAPTLLAAETAADVRHEIWLKLLGNFNFGPIAALTGATNGEIGADPGLRALCAATYEEAARAGARLGLHPGMSADERIDLGAALGDFKTSMLQDFERRRPPEIDAILRAVADVGAAVGEPTPLTRALLALAAQKARGLGIYEAPT